MAMGLRPIPGLVRDWLDLRPARLGMFPAMLLVTTGLGCCARPGDPALGTVQLASIWELTGQVGQFGAAAHQAVQLATEEFNRTLPPDAPRVELITQDTESTLQGAAAAFRAAVARGRPLAILGPLTSGAAMVLAPLAEQSAIVMITTASTPQLTTAGPFTFRIYPSDTYEAQVMADYAVANGIAAAAVVYPQNDYGAGLDQAFAESASPGLSLVARVPYPPDQADFRVIAARLLEFKPPAVFAPGYPATVGPLARALRDAGYTGPIYSSLGIEDPSLFALGGRAVDGIIYTVTSLPDSIANPKRARFERLFAERFGTAAGFPALYGWDVATIVLDAIRAGARSAADLQHAFREDATFDGVTGRFTFDANGDVRRLYALKRVSVATRSFEPVARP